MTESDFLVRGAIIGVAAASCMDLWALVLRRGFRIRTLDYALLGRWIGHFPKGRFFHEPIASSDAVHGERWLGWLAHYAIGVVFAWMLLAIWGASWLESPSLVPALIVGMSTIVAPWFVMQRGMGAGIAGAHTPDPGATRLRNLGSHLVYGIGLYLSALVLALAR
jgi:hypothetical protein